MWELGTSEDDKKELFSIDKEKLLVSENQVPRCLHCGGTARPNVSMHGDTQNTWVKQR